MKIIPQSVVPSPVAGTTPRRDSASAKQVAVTRPTPPRVDTVEFSSTGEASSVAARDRMAGIQDRIRTQFYDSPSVAQAVARRLMASGDL